MRPAAVAADRASSVRPRRIHRLSSLPVSCNGPTMLVASRVARRWLTMDYLSVEQGCMQVLTIRILLQTPLRLLLPSMIIVAMFVPHLFIGNAIWQRRSQRVRIQPT
jgi:hypothetical protein